MMYLGKYPDTGDLPPGYRGVALSLPQEEAPVCEELKQEPPPTCEPCCEDLPVCAKDPPCAPSFGARGLLDHIFSHKLDMEDLLLLALIVMLISSGADLELILMLALLFVFGL